MSGHAVGRPREPKGDTGIPLSFPARDRRPPKRTKRLMPRRRGCSGLKSARCREKQQCRASETLTKRLVSLKKNETSAPLRRWDHDHSEEALRPVRQLRHPAPILSLVPWLGVGYSRTARLLQRRGGLGLTANEADVRSGRCSSTADGGGETSHPRGAGEPLLVLPKVVRFRGDPQGQARMAQGHVGSPCAVRLRPEQQRVQLRGLVSDLQRTEGEPDVRDDR